MIQSFSKDHVTNLFKFPKQIESQKVKHHGEVLYEVYANSERTECWDLSDSPQKVTNSINCSSNYEQTTN